MNALQPFIVTSWHGAGVSDMPADVKMALTKSELNPKRLNVFALILNKEGHFVHGFYGLPAAAYKAEIAKGLDRLNLSVDTLPAKERPAALPDLERTPTGIPAGVRLLMRQQDAKPVVEVVPMKAEEWNAFALPTRTRAIDAKDLRNWLVQLYPAGIDPADEKKPFNDITSSLELIPAGADNQGRYAILRGKVRLAKGDETASAFEGTLEAVVTYRPGAPEVRSVRGVVEGDYLYRQRGTQRLPLRVAIESRPD